MFGCSPRFKTTLITGLASPARKVAPSARAGWRAVRPVAARRVTSWCHDGMPKIERRAAGTIRASALPYSARRRAGVVSSASSVCRAGAKAGRTAVCTVAAAVRRIGAGCAASTISWRGTVAALHTLAGTRPRLAEMARTGGLRCVGPGRRIVPRRRR